MGSAPVSAVRCAAGDCLKLPSKRGYCDLHYRRALKAGTLKRLTTQDRFWAKVDTSGSCWLWTGAVSGGYGSLGIDGKQYRAHRVAYEWLVGPIPTGLFLDHLCRTPLCVNPVHLEPVTNRENVMRGVRPTNLTNGDTCRNGLHPWPASASPNGAGRYAGRMSCRECRRAKDRRRMAARRAAS